MPAEARARVEVRVAEEMRMMPLRRLCEALRLTQKQLAEAMNIDLRRVSRLEKRADVYASTLRNFDGALGGKLDLVARFPDGRVLISHLGDPEDATVITQPVE
jgi:transcriptional regulator with XRE-family HTH domain